MPLFGRRAVLLKQIICIFVTDMPKFAQVLLPVPVGEYFTYSIPQDMQHDIRPLMRVVVPFGTRKYYTGIVVGLTDTFTETYALKDITWLPDKAPILRRPQLELWQWISGYYMCAIGDVYKAALPAGLKIEAETIVTANPDFLDENAPELNSPQTKVWEMIMAEGSRSIKDIERSGIKDAMQVVYSLMEKGAVTISEKLQERFRPKKEEFYDIALPHGDNEALRSAFDALKRSPRRQKLFMKLLQLSGFTNPGGNHRQVSRNELKDCEEFDAVALRDFVKRGLITRTNREISRFKWTPAPLKSLPVLSQAQAEALDGIHTSFLTHGTTLLHGVTASGKTEIYIHLIDYVLRQKRQVLFLVPEIALTTQLTGRLQAVFGEWVVIYHSRFSDAQRTETWQRMLQSEQPVVVIGARSSIFLPFAGLGLVIVDEEHEQSYKQLDPAPRYNARDVATVLAGMHGAKTLLASATPAIDTYFKAREGKYGLVSLTERYSGAPLPQIEVIDMAAERKKSQIRESIATRTLQYTAQALERGEQVIFFNNRRGYSPLARCKSCEFIPKCTDCDVSLTYHKGIDRLVCHYCGKEYTMSPVCPVCHEPSMEIVGYGTERVEDNISSGFPGYKILRMDLDTTRNKDDYATIIDTFSQHKADILVGTQMVTKGLDFDNVSTVAVLNADQLINYPDFRAAERAFNMLEQVSGRAGRKSTEGKVLIQTRQPAHPVLDFVLNHDYTGFYNHELQERKSFGYPPFIRLIYLYVRHKDDLLCQAATNELMTRLLNRLGNRIKGPHQPPVTRVKTLYIRRIMIKVEPQVSVAQVKDILTETVREVKTAKQFRSADFYFDVDPM